MKQMLRALAVGLVLSFGSSGAAETQLIPDNIIGTHPPEFLAHWTRLSVLGLRNRLYPIIWVSPQAFPRTGFEKLLLLTPDEYGGVQALLGRSTCLDPTAAFPEAHALQVSEYAVGKGQANCRLSARSSCEYLQHLSSLPGIRGTSRTEEMLRDFANELECSLDGGPMRPN